MTSEIEAACNLEEYLQAWKTIMSQFYWYKENPVFDWNKDEEIDEMKEVFFDESYLFLIARNSDTQEIAGIMEMRLSKPEAVIWRWTPAMKPGNDEDVIGSKLLKAGIRIAQENGCSTIRMIIKYPLGIVDSARKIIELYETNGFSDPHAPSAGLFMSTKGKTFKPYVPSGIQYATREGFTAEVLADLTVRCFTSTEDDCRIHGKDLGVTDPEVALVVMRRMLDGGYGQSPSDFTHIALSEGIPVGIVGSFIRPYRYQPHVGVLGPVGVLPEYRRKGISSFLVTSAIKKLEEMGCQYIAVGTPQNNLGAIKMYQGVGFEDRDRLVTLRLSL